MCKASSVPHCAKPKCGKVLFQPIPCNVSYSLRLSLSVYMLMFWFQTCKQQFCPQHRFPKDHMCTQALPSNVSTTKKPNQTAASSAAALAALKRAANATSSAVSAKANQSVPVASSVKRPTPTQPSTVATAKKPSTAPAPASSSRSNPFSKTDR